MFKPVKLLYQGQVVTLEELRSKFEKISLAYIPIPNITIERIFGCLYLAEFSSKNVFTELEYQCIILVCSRYGPSKTTLQSDAKSIIFSFHNLKALQNFLYDQNSALSDIRTMILSC